MVPEEGLTRSCVSWFLEKASDIHFGLYDIDKSILPFLAEKALPPRVDTRDAANAKSEVATLDQVAVSDKKRMSHRQFAWALVTTYCHTAEHQLPRDGTDCFEKSRHPSIYCCLMYRSHQSG